MEYIFETEHLKIRKFEIEDAKCLYENHLEEEVKRWIPNESYVDMEETKEAIKRSEEHTSELQSLYS